MAEFTWDDQRREAAQLIARGDLSFGRIARKLGVHPRTLYNWREHPDFIAQVDQHISDFKAAVRRKSIALVEGRVAAQFKRWRALHQIARERGAAAGYDGVPGWKTGWLVHDVKSVGAGVSAERVDLYNVDTGLLKAILDIEKQAAIELGQWNENKAPDAYTEKVLKAFGILERELAGEPGSESPPPVQG